MFKLQGFQCQFGHALTLFRNRLKLLSETTDFLQILFLSRFYFSPNFDLFTTKMSLPCLPNWEEITRSDKLQETNSKYRNTMPEKSVRIWSYSSPHFSRIFPHSDWIRRDTPYSVRMWENAGKMWTRITPNKDTLYAVHAGKLWSSSRSICKEVNLGSLDFWLDSDTFNIWLRSWLNVS